MILNYFTVNSLNCKNTRTGFYNASLISSTSDQDFTCDCNRNNRIFFFILENPRGFVCFMCMR